MMLYRLALLTLLGFAGLALPTSAAAAKKIVIADCGVGGCRCMLSSMTLDEVTILTGEAAPPGAEAMTLVTAFDQLQWSPKSPKEINHYFGGSGACPIELFPSASYGPRDGVWEFHNSAVDMSQCPFAAMYGAVPATTVRKRIVWGGRFDPNKYWAAETAGMVRWSRIDDSNWRGKVGLPTGPISTALRVRLVNPVTIRGWNEVGLTGEEAHYTQCFSMQSDFTARWISES